MLHINRKTEYALLALQHMHLKETEKSAVTSTREISDTYHIPYPLLAKVMQKLAGKGLIKSVQGTKGGYILAKRPADITIADVLQVFEGPIAVAECLREERITCPQWDGCMIKDPFYELNRKIHHLLTETTLQDLVRERVTSPKMPEFPKSIPQRTEVSMKSKETR